jgi:integrase
LSGAGTAPLLHPRLEVEGEHPGKVSFDPHPCSPLVQARVLRVRAEIEATQDDLAKHNPLTVDLALVIIGTRLRRSEALGSRFADIDWSGRITIRQTVIEHEGEWSLREGTKRAAGYRTIGVADTVIEALRRQQARGAMAAEARPVLAGS